MVGYPTKKNREVTALSPITSRRGMSLEDDLNKSNQFYLETDRANVHKKPTPITIVTVSYPSRSKAKITEAYFRTPSTTDYNGVYRGRAIDFEAKETKSKTSFTLSSVHEHQITHLRNVLRHGAIAFAIIRFTSLDLTYYVAAEKLIDFIDTTQRSSIPLSWFKEYALHIPLSLTPPIDYLRCIDTIYFKGEKKNDAETHTKIQTI